MADSKRITLPPDLQEFLDSLKIWTAEKLKLSPQHVLEVHMPRWSNILAKWEFPVRVLGHPADTELDVQMESHELTGLLMNFEREQQLKQECAKEQLEKALIEAELEDGHLDRLFEERP